MQPPAVNVHLLVEHPGALPLLRQWFEREWSAYYGPGGRADAMQDPGEGGKAGGRR
jgi:hypothetical protein